MKQFYTTGNDGVSKKSCNTSLSKSQNEKLMSIDLGKYKYMK
jgi:hypothetical protein